MNSPTPQQIKQARKEAGLSRRQFGALVYSAYRTVQDWELGKYRMHPGLWELARHKIRQVQWLVVSQAMDAMYKPASPDDSSRMGLMNDSNKGFGSP